MKFDYCPQCGEKLTLKQAGDDGLVPYCLCCEKYYFEIFQTCVIVLVANEYDEVALLRQDYLSKEYRTFPAGYMQVGETAENAAIREVKEELGLEVENIDFAGTYWFSQKDILMIGFIAKTKKAPFKISSEVDDASWVNYKEVPALIFPDTSDNSAFRLYEKYARLNFQ